MSYSISPPIYLSKPQQSYLDKDEHPKTIPPHFRPLTTHVEKRVYSINDVQKYYDFNKTRLMTTVDYDNNLQDLLNGTKRAENDAERLVKQTEVEPTVLVQEQPEATKLKPEGYNVQIEGPQMVKIQTQFNQIRRLVDEYEDYLKKARLSEELKKRMREDFYKKLEDSFPIIKNFTAKLTDPITGKPVHNLSAALRTAMEGTLSGMPQITTATPYSTSQANQVVKTISRAKSEDSGRTRERMERHNRETEERKEEKKEEKITPENFQKRGKK